MVAENIYLQMNVPEYSTKNGKTLPVYPTGESDVMIAIQETNFEEFEAYIEALKQKGYKKQAENNICENIFAVYGNHDLSISLSFFPKLSTVHAVYGKPRVFPAAKKAKSNQKRASTVAQIGLVGVGMCYCIQLPDDSFIVIDGGYRNQNDTDTLFEYMKSRIPIDAKKIHISAWFISHTHPDHTVLATDFLNQYHENLILDMAVYNFPKFDSVKIIKDNIESNKRYAENFVKAVREYFPEAMHYICRTGEKIGLPGVTIQTIFTHEDTYPEALTSFNNTSSAWKFAFDSGTVFMVLGDTWQPCCKQMAETYCGDFLKSDILQLTHHGLIGGHINLYKLIDPEVCLWATPKERFESSEYCLGNSKYCNYNKWIRDEKVKKREHYHHGNTVILMV